jgi:hypothetical protein
MKSINKSRRFIRKEVNRIAMAIKQIEFRIMRFHGFVKRKLREELKELRRMKDAILRRLAELTYDVNINSPAMQEIRADITTLHERCGNLKAKYL